MQGSLKIMGGGWGKLGGAKRECVYTLFSFRLYLVSHWSSPQDLSHLSSCFLYVRVRDPPSTADGWNNQWRALGITKKMHFFSYIFISYIKPPSQINYVYNNLKEDTNFSNTFLQFVVDVIFFSLDTTERLSSGNYCESVWNYRWVSCLYTSGMNHFLETSNRNSNTFRFKDHEHKGWPHPHADPAVKVHML